MVLTLRYVVLPNVEGYQGDIISRVATASGMDVSAAAIRGGWSGMRPYVELEGVVFREIAGSTSTSRLAGAEALRLPRLTASLSWWSLLVGQIRLVDVNFIGPELSLSRGKDGLLYFAGHALNAPQPVEDDGRLLDWLLEQSGVKIEHATLTWTDEFSPSAVVKFTDVALRIEKSVIGHVIGIAVTPPLELAKRIELRADLKLQKSEGLWNATGTVFATATNTNFAALRAHLPVPDVLLAGVGNLRAWIDVDNSGARRVASAVGAGNAAVAFNPIRAITADINLIDTKAQLSPEVAPLNIARLAGRIEYKLLDGGFTVGSKAFEFRTREGVTLPPADFSLTMQHQGSASTATGEITGTGIDLKVIAALLEYFPVPKDVRTVVARFSPRGVVRNSSFAWTGYLDKIAKYRIKGQMKDFAINADGAVPGISGFTGTVEGDDTGGRFTVISKDLKLDLPGMMRAPLKFDALESEGNWKIGAGAFNIDFQRVAFANPELAGEISGRYSRFLADGPRAKEEKGPGTLDIQGKLNRAKAVGVANYLPNTAAQTREYIEWAVRDGEIQSADFSLKGEIYEFPFHLGKGGNFRLSAKVKDVDFRYAEGWPVAEDATGELIFENTAFSAKLVSGKIFNARLGATMIAVDDFLASPYTLSIQGETAARGEDVTRFLRESPLVNGVGAFTKSVSIEGPGRLELALKIPIHAPEGSKATAKVNGSYTLRGAQAKPVLGPLVTGLTGSVAFTEGGVKSNGITGLAYGNPLTIGIASGPDGVATDFAGRTDISLLGELLPFALPQQVTGSTDFSGRILARESGVDISVETSLLGVTSALPAPLAKRADEARKLRLAFANTGLPSEKITLGLAGNAMPAASSAGNSATLPLADAVESRIDARFQRRIGANGSMAFRGGIASVGVELSNAPLPDGLWFAGTMPLLDFDSWRDAFAKFYPPKPLRPADSATQRTNDKSGVDIAGFDFKLGGMVAYGRPFDTMMLKGRHGGEDWRLTVESDGVVGDVSWRAGAFNDRGAVRARLKKLVLADEVPQPKEAARAVVSAVTTREADFPALDIIADRFTLKDRELGRLELRATPMDDNWRIDQLVISTGHAKLEMDGLWQRFSDPENPAGVPGKSRTTMNMKVEASNLNALFSQFGFGDQLKRGTGKLQGKLSWPGHTYQFQTTALSGEFKVEARNGQFAQIPVGAGKLLALISLQSIPRRITLDFRDVFSEGFAFEKIDGDIKINSGIMHTDNFEIVGTAANVKMSGEVSLPSEQTKLKLIVVPSLGEGVALGVGVLLGPVGGLGALAVQKLLQGALSYEYAVTGSWDNPQVDRIKNEARPAKDGDAPASTPASAPAASTRKTS